MIAAHLEPKGLDRAAEPVADFYRDGNQRAMAVAGSLRLRNAIMKLGRVKTTRPSSFRPRTWGARKIAKVSVTRIRCEVAEYFGRSVADMLSKRGNRSICLHRQVAMYLARECTTASYPDIAKVFGGRDHTTVMYACKKIGSAVECDLRIRDDVDHLRKLLAA